MPVVPKRHRRTLKVRDVRRALSVTRSLSTRFGGTARFLNSSVGHPGAGKKAGRIPLFAVISRIHPRLSASPYICSDTPLDSILYCGTPRLVGVCRRYGRDGTRSGHRANDVCHGKGMKQSQNTLDARWCSASLIHPKGSSDAGEAGTADGVPVNCRLPARH